MAKVYTQLELENQGLHSVFFGGDVKDFTHNNSIAIFFVSFLDVTIAIGYYYLINNFASIIVPFVSHYECWF